MKMYDKSEYYRAKFLSLKGGEKILQYFDKEGGVIPSSLSIFRRWGAVVLPIDTKYLLITMDSNNIVYYTILEYLQVDIRRRIIDKKLAEIVNKVKEIIREKD